MKKIISKACSIISIIFPFLQPIINLNNIKETSLQVNGYTDGRYIYLNLNFLNEQKVGLYDIIFTLLHEATHIILEHTSRSNKCNHQLWNLAIDLCTNIYVLDASQYLSKEFNNYILKTTFKKKGRVYDNSNKYNPINSKFPNSENVYSAMKNEIEKTGKSLEENWEIKIGNFVYDNSSPNLFESHDRLFTGYKRNNIDFITTSYNNTNNQNCYLEKYLKNLYSKNINKNKWKNILERVILNHSRYNDEYSYSKIRRNMIIHSIILPSTTNENDSCDITFCFDTSGSICYTEIFRFFEESLCILEYNTKVRIILYNHEVYYDKIIDNKSIKEIKDTFIKLPIYEGGTSYQKLYEHLADHITGSLLINFTDGLCVQPTISLPIKVCWCIINNPSWKISNNDLMVYIND